MSALADYAWMFSDLADALTDAMQQIAADKPNTSAEVGVWQLQLAQIGNKSNELRSVSNQLLALDAKGVLDSVNAQLTQLSAATRDAHDEIVKVTRINHLLDVLGKFVSVGADVVLFVAAPSVTSAEDIVSAVKGAVTSAQQYRQAENPPSTSL